MKTLDQHILEMKNVADTLIPYTFPLVEVKESKVIDVLKQRLLIVDGYWIHTYYGKYNYGKYFVQRLELASYNFPFLPMNIVCKLAQNFLGTEGLKFIEKIFLRTKIYVWTNKIAEGKVIDLEDGLSYNSYCDLKYKVPNSIIN